MHPRAAKPWSGIGKFIRNQNESQKQTSKTESGLASVGQLATALLLLIYQV